MTPPNEFVLDSSHAAGTTRIARSLVKRAAIAILVGVVTWIYATLYLRAAGPYFVAGDFTWHWRAADALIRGFSPYKVINTMPVYPFTGGYPYFLSTAAIMVPFGLMSPPAAMALFSGLSAAILAFAMTRDGFWRLPLLMSAPLVWSSSTGQLSPLVTSAMLLPILGWLAPIKYNLGAVGAVYSLSAKYVLTAAAIVALSVVVWPWWPREWWAELSDVPRRWYHVPVLVPGGFVLLVALLRWRRPEARLLAAMACVPQTMLFYDQLPLGLVARSYRQALAFAAASYIAPLVGVWLYGAAPIERGVLFARLAPIIVGLYYVPCLAVVLVRPNVGAVPAWLESFASFLPPRLRGARSPTEDAARDARNSELIVPPHSDQ